MYVCACVHVYIYIYISTQCANYVVKATLQIHGTLPLKLLVAKENKVNIKVKSIAYTFIQNIQDMITKKLIDNITMHKIQLNLVLVANVKI